MNMPRSLRLGLVTVPLEAATPVRTALALSVVDVVPLDEVGPQQIRRTEIATAGSGGERAFALLRESLRRAGCVAIAQAEDGGRVVLRPHGAYLLVEEAFSDAEMSALARASATTLDSDRVELELWDGLIARLRDQRLREAPRKPLAKAKVIRIGDVARRRRGA
jgi:non-homologous end joining protein Ku